MPISSGSVNLSRSWSSRSTSSDVVSPFISPTHQPTLRRDSHTNDVLGVSLAERDERLTVLTKPDGSEVGKQIQVRFGHAQTIPTFTISASPAQQAILQRKIASTPPNMIIPTSALTDESILKHASEEAQALIENRKYVLWGQPDAIKQTLRLEKTEQDQLKELQELESKKPWNASTRTRTNEQEKKLQLKDSLHHTQLYQDDYTTATSSYPSKNNKSRSPSKSRPSSALHSPHSAGHRSSSSSSSSSSKSKHTVVFSPPSTYSQTYTTYSSKNTPITRSTHPLRSFNRELDRLAQEEARERQLEQKSLQVVQQQVEAEQRAKREAELEESMLSTYMRNVQMNRAQKLGQEQRFNRSTFE